MKHYTTAKQKAISLATCLAVLGGSAVPATLQAAAADTTVYYGDMDGSTTLTSADLSLLKRKIADPGAAFSYAHAGTAADINTDGATTIADAVLLAQYLSAQIDAFPNGTYTVISTLDRYYAIDAEYVNCYNENTNTGFAGEGYANYYNEVGGYVNWTVNAPTAGNYKVTFRYANGGSDTNDQRTCNITVNGGDAYLPVYYPSTGNWTTWSEVSIVVALQAGSNTIKATAAGATGGPNMDYIELEQTDAPADTMVEIGAKQVEALDRGVVAAKAANGVLVSWRILGTDDENTTYKVYRNGEPTVIYEGNTSKPSSFLDTSGTATDWYTVDVYQGDTCTEFACGSYALPNYSSKVGSGGYTTLNLDQPADMTMPDGSTCSYSPNDCSVGDVDGDGQYELFVKWDPNNSKDNADDGYTGNVYIDCYKFDGTKLWRIDLGRNIRAGAHYTQFMVYDYDADGKAEMICKTADATVDGVGTVIGNASADYRNSSGYVLDGSEYLTLFEGATGKALDTVNFVPGRGNVSSWGDNYGNRVDRYLGAVAYLDGATPSCVMARGYYTRMTVTAWDVVNGKLVHRWAFDSDNGGSSAAAAGNGNHNCFAADADGDGKDEIIMGACVIDDNGTLLYSTGFGHGDTLHVGDLVPSNPGLEIFMAHEHAPYGISLRDAATGKVLFRKEAGGDTGRGIAGNIVAGNSAAEFIGIHDSIVYNESGTQILTWAEITKWSPNSVVYWTGALERGVLDRQMVDQYGAGRVFSGSNAGAGYNNSSKANACLTADIFGDWREEMLFPCGSNQILIFSTTFTTEYAMPTLMHDVKYRTSVAGQNVAYNQPPHTSYFLGTGYEIPKFAPVYPAG